ncbi:MAG: hypothetical protein ACXVG9_12030 [Terriglobales bacterium]
MRHTELDKLLAASEGPAFYVVSKRKLALLFLLTFTGYAFYWFYRNWRCYKGKHPEASRFGSTVSPAPRAAFSMFFTHALFRKVKAYGHAQPAVARWRTKLHASILVAMMLLANCTDVLIPGPAGEMASFAGIGVLVLPFLKAQDMINLSCGDPEGEGNDRLTKANWAWMIAGAAGWVFSVLQALY